MELSLVNRNNVPKTTYKQIKQVGEGAYGKVYKAIDTRQNGQLVAIKVIKTDQEHEGFSTTALREISIMRELKHPNICRLIDVLWNVE